MFKLVSKLLEDEREDAIMKAVKKSNQTQLHELLEFISKWNTNTRFSHVAQRMLQMILRAFSIEQLAKLPDISRLVDSLLAYSGAEDDPCIVRMHAAHCSGL